jgi:hypothetical protein
MSNTTSGKNVRPATGGIRTSPESLSIYDSIDKAPSHLVIRNFPVPLAVDSRGDIDGNQLREEEEEEKFTNSSIDNPGFISRLRRFFQRRPSTGGSTQKSAEANGCQSLSSPDSIEGSINFIESYFRSRKPVLSRRRVTEPAMSRLSLGSEQADASK